MVILKDIYGTFSKLVENRNRKITKKKKYEPTITDPTDALNFNNLVIGVKSPTNRIVKSYKC
jgi:hypothetical protein